MLLFVVGSAALAFWVAVCRPKLAPANLRSGGIHLAVAIVVGTILEPVLHAVPGLPSALSLFVALFAVGLPAITYMLLAGMWLVQLVAGQVSTPRR
jgi:hypothetical protein